MTIVSTTAKVVRQFKNSVDNDMIDMRLLQMDIMLFLANTYQAFRNRTEPVDIYIDLKNETYINSRIRKICQIATGVEHEVTTSLARTGASVYELNIYHRGTMSSKVKQVSAMGAALERCLSDIRNFKYYTDKNVTRS